MEAALGSFGSTNRSSFNSKASVDGNGNQCPKSPILPGLMMTDSLASVALCCQLGVLSPVASAAAAELFRFIHPHHCFPDHPIAPFSDLLLPFSILIPFLQSCSALRRTFPFLGSITCFRATTPPLAPLRPVNSALVECCATQPHQHVSLLPTTPKMTSNVIYDGVQRTDNDTESRNTLFAGQKLWFAHTVPQRKWLIENAQNNGAVIVVMDKDADVRLVDHAKKNNAPGTHSYKYVENSIRNGVRQNLADHVVGLATRVSRPVGSTTTAPKHGRTPFTNEDDQQLWDWVKPHEERGLAWKGNEIYKQLESVNPRHTFQSWRDRYIKHTRFQKRTSTPITEETQPLPEPSTLQTIRSVQQRKRPRQDADDAEGHEPIAHDDLDPSSIRDDRSVRRSDQRPGGPSHTASSLSKEEILKRKDSLERPPSKRRREIPREIPSPKKDTSKMEDRLDRSPAKRPRDEPLEMEPEHGRFEIVTGWEIPSDIEFEAVRQSFTIDETMQLYHLVPKLTNVTAENFEEAWGVLAASEDWTGHTPQEWKTYFNNVVLPEYCRRNMVPITEIAPYLAQEQQIPSTSTPKKGPPRNAGTDGNPINSNMKGCDFCHEVKSARWHLDHKGNRVCNKCAIFLRVAGVPRPSTSAVEVVDDLEDEDLSRSTRARTPQTTATLWPISAPASNYVHRGTSPITSNQDPDLSEEGYSGLAKVKSPVFRPDSPSFDRVPEPNEARKRSAGKGSQSQSTSQSSIKTGSQSQGIELSAKPELPDAVTGSLEVLQQSKNLTDSQTTPRSDMIPQFLHSTKMGRDRWRLRDEPRNLDFLTQSSTRSDQLPSQRPANASVMDFIEEDEGTVLPPPEVATQKDSQQILLSESFLSEDEAVDGTATHSAGQVTSQALRPVEGLHEPQTSPLSVHLVSDNSSRVDSQSVSSSPEPSARSLALDDEEPETRTRFDRFETAPETLDDFDSAVEEQQPDPSARLAKGKERRTSTQALFNDIDEGLDESHLDFELPEPEGGWQKALGYDPDQLDDHELYTQEPHGREASRTNGIGKAKIKDEPQNNSALADLRLPPKPVPASTQESDGPQTSRWFAAQEAYHTSIHRLTLKPILFKALEATSFDFDLASEVVGIILNQLPSKYKRRDKFIPGLEINIPQDLPGVWTIEDDNLLFSEESKDVEAVRIKHGDDACHVRFEFVGQFVES